MQLFKCTLNDALLHVIVADQAKNLDSWYREGLERLSLEEDVVPQGEPSEEESLTEEQLDILAVQQNKVIEVSDQY